MIGKHSRLKFMFHRAPCTGAVDLLRMSGWAPTGWVKCCHWATRDEFSRSQNLILKWYFSFY